MPHPSREIVLVAPTTQTSSGNSEVLIITEQFTAAIVMLQVTAASGTSPTLDLKIQRVITGAAASDADLDNASGTEVFDDYLSFSQVTGTATRIFPIVGAGGQGANQDYAIADGTLTAGTARNGPIGRKWRAKWVITGTSPSFTFSVVAQLIP